MTIANTIGIEMPPEFPTNAYNAVNDKIKERHAQGAPWKEYAGGWNAVAIRYRAAADADDAFTASIGQGTGPSSAERFAQETALFSFFVNGLASIESFGYALHAIGAMLRPAEFPMATPDELRAVKPAVVRDRFAGQFPGAAVTASFAGLVIHGTFKEWSDIRNVLAHRQAPPRDHYVSVNEGPQEGANDADWTAWRVLGGLALNDRTTTDKRVWLAGQLTDCVLAAKQFVMANF